MGGDEVDDDLTAFGISQPIENEQVEQDLLIFPDSWLSVQVFVALSRCWRIDNMNGVYLGLDRPSIVSTLQLMGIKKSLHSEIFNDLQMMEGEAIAILNKRD